MLKQRGITLFGGTLMAIAIIFIAIGAMKILPKYLEFYTIKRVIATMEKQEDLNSMTPADIRKSFDKRATIDNITAIDAKDLDISKGDGGRTIVSANYVAKVPLVGNLSATMDFSYATSGK
ncbi:MAG: DUF4845 domain-containing protein [Burkholderiales bacterium]